MTDLLNNVVEAHGGLKRWNELETVSACLIQGGVLRAVKVSRACSTTFSSRQACVRSRSRTIRPALPAGEACLPPERVAIETTDGTVAEALEQPRGLARRSHPETPWTTLQLAYFVGTAMWTCLAQPFTFILPGFETAELEPWQENGEQQRRLRAVWLSYLATRNTVQTVHFGDDGLIRREDYDVEILGGSMGAHYMSDYTRAAGTMLPTRHPIFPRTPEGQALTEPLLVSIDLSEIAFA